MTSAMGQYAGGRALLETASAVVNTWIRGADMAQGICSVDGCAKAAVPSNKLAQCHTHLYRHYRYGSSDLPVRQCSRCGARLGSPWGRMCPPCRVPAMVESRARYAAKKAAQRCEAPDCDKPRKSGSWCVTHTMRMERYGSLEGREREVTCECGQTFRSHHHNPKFCSRACLVRFSSKRGNWLAHRRSQDVVKRLRPAILARDGWTCYLCATPIAPALRFPHPLSLTIDHVIPLSAGGTNEIENLRPAHLSCNVRKSDDLPTWWERASA